MLNEGIIVNNSAALVKSEMVKQIRRLGPTTPDQFERTVFRALTGHDRDEVDWDIEDNQAGYYTWLKSFDELISELVEDGYIRIEDEGLVPTDAEPHGEYSQLVYPRA
ncbi:MAG: hypothetical protein HQ581_23920 [Planctomycetes bacterium]|nr:hypothetical protein [Planctomycetota bacterium]